MASSNPALLRQLGVVSATALVVSNMIGTGIFTSTGFLAGQLGSPHLVLWSWVVGAGAAFLGAICYAELGINFPSSGGEYVYLTRAFGPTWGFMTGWASFFAGFSAPIATVALAFSGYLGHFDQRFLTENARVLVGSGEWTLQLGWAQVVACSLVAVFTVLNLFGIQRAARVQNVLTALKVTVLVVFVALAFASGHGDPANFSQTAVRDVSTPLAAQFAISMFWIYVAYSGWNAATYVAEELRQPARTLPFALAIGTGIVAVLYLALNVVFIYGAPLEAMKGKLAVGAFAASRLFGPQVAGIFSALMALSLMATVNAMITIGPRVYYAMAKNGAFPSAAARVHPKWHTPAIAIVAQAICAMLMTMTPFPQLVIYIGFTLNFFAVLSVASLFRFRRRPGWQKLRVVSFCYPLFPLLFLAVGVWMTFYGIQLKPLISLAAIATVATGALVYHARWKSRATKTPAVETY
ncbi:MAG TPA: amino acid permease [Bryobacteraceae bacterium]